MDRHNTDAVRRELDRPRFRETDEPELRRRVVAEPVHAAQTRYGRVVDDDARSLPDHLRDDPPCDQPRALQVDVQHRVPLVLGQLVRAPVCTDAGVVEQDVDAPELRHGRVNRSRDRRVVPNITLKSDALRGRLGAFALKAAEVVLGAEHVPGILELPGDVKGRDARARFRQRQRRRPALPMRRAGNEGDLAVEFAVRHL